MNRIVVPTDLTIDSLVLLKEVLAHENSNKLDILMVYGAHLPSSISDLLLYSKKQHIASLCDADFLKAKTIMEQTYGDKINSLHIDIFVGATHRAFTSFLEGKNVCRMYIPEYCKTFEIPRKKGFSIIPFMEKSKIETIRMTYSPLEIPANQDILSTLLTS